MKGRKPKPTALKKIAGTLSKQPLKASEPTAALDNAVEPPLRLKGLARLEWTRFAPILRDAGLLTLLDRNALAMYCDQYELYCQSMDELTKLGAVVDNRDGVATQSQHFRIVNKCAAVMARMLAEFGMTPSSRTRVQVSPQVDPQSSEWDDF